MTADLTPRLSGGLMGRVPGRRAAWVLALCAIGLTSCSGGEADSAADPPDDAQGSPTASQSTAPSPDASPLRCRARSVTLAGTPASDELKATKRRDVIHSLSGDDRISNVGKNDVVCTGGGADEVRTTRSRSGAWVVILGAGDDHLQGDAFQIRAGAGDDTLRLWSSGAGSVHPGTGDDSVRVLNPRSDPFNNPCVEYKDAVRPVVVNLRKGWAQGQGRDRLRDVRCVKGSRFDDWLIGGDAAEWLEVTRGRNRIYAGGGDDQVMAYGAGPNLLALDAGNDFAIGGPGQDTLYGGAGNDRLHGINGGDRIYGGPGNDQLHGTYSCDLGSSAGDGMGDGSSNKVYGGPGDDLVTGDVGDDVIDGGPGVDSGYPGRPRRPGNDVFLSVESPTQCG